MDNNTLKECFKKIYEEKIKSLEEKENNG